MSAQFRYKIVDLTHTITPDIPNWPGSCGFSSSINLDYEKCDGEVKFRVMNFKTNSGVGTHIDAPAHCIPGAISVEAISLNKLIAPAYAIDISVKADQHYKLTAQDVLEFETKFGRIAEESFVIINTGWSKHWPNFNKYHNNYQFPNVSIEAAQTLLDRNIVGIGIDTFSPDLPVSRFPVHKLLLGSGKYIVENIVNAELLPATGAFVIIMPLKAQGLTEAPVRIAGLINQ